MTTGGRKNLFEWTFCVKLLVISTRHLKWEAESLFALPDFVSDLTLSQSQFQSQESPETALGHHRALWRQRAQATATSSSAHGYFCFFLSDCSSILSFSFAYWTASAT